MKEKEIIRTLNALSDTISKGFSDMGSRFENIEQRLSSTEDQQKQLIVRQNKQKRDIDALFARLDALCEDKPIWASKDGREIGVRKEDAYSVFKKMGFSRLEAMHLLDKAGRLSRNMNDRHLTKVVRSPEIGKTRAVVIFAEDI